MTRPAPGGFAATFIAVSIVCLPLILGSVLEGISGGSCCSGRYCVPIAPRRWACTRSIMRDRILARGGLSG